MTAAQETQATKDRLIADFKTVVSDAEELIKATASQTGERAQAARARIEESLSEARERLATLQDDLIDQSKAAARAINRMVHDNPWQSVAVAAGIGFLLGLITDRR